MKYDNIWKIATGQRHDYTTDSLLDYNYFKNYYMMIAIDLSKQRTFDVDPKAIQQINFDGNLERQALPIMFLVSKKRMKHFYNFHKEL